jgi:hypothetical protein
MKRKTASFTGMRPIFTGSPSIVQGGFNLDVENQHFAVGDTVPAGTLAIKVCIHVASFNLCIVVRC